MIEIEKLTQIVKEVQNDKVQFELLYSHIIDKVYFWCFTVINNEADAKDAAQESMIRIYNNIDTLDNAEMFIPWMYRLVKNNCLTYLRLHKKNESEFLYNEDYNESFESNVKEERRDSLPEEAYNLKETKQLIASFVNKLPQKQKEVITLYYLEEMKITEIANVLDYNAGSVKSRLHEGRKNLELQVKEYQEKNNVKLYSLLILPMLGLIIAEYRDEMCSKQKFSYNKKTYEKNGNSVTNGLTKIASTKIVIGTVVIIIASVVAIILSSTLLNETDDSNESGRLNESTNSDLAMYKKIKSSSYIEDITYIEFPTRMDVDVAIKLKKNTKDKDIKFLFNDKEIHFEKKDKEILIKVRENGIYTIVIKKEKLNFEINKIDKYAPELVEVFNEDEYLLLVMNDELSQIDYQKSFIEYKERKYVIPEDLKLDGKFKDEIKVTLFHQDGSWIKYNLNLKQ